MNPSLMICYCWILRSGRCVFDRHVQCVCLQATDYMHRNSPRLQKQDHYAVLGLSHLRYHATQDQIKIARTSSNSSTPIPHHKTITLSTQIAKKSSNTTQTKNPLSQAIQTTTPFSNVFKKRTKSSRTPKNVVNTIPSINIMLTSSKTYLRRQRRDV